MKNKLICRVILIPVLTTILLLTGCSRTSGPAQSSGASQNPDSAQSSGASQNSDPAQVSDLTGTAVSSDTQIRDTDFCLDTVVTITLNGTDDQALLDSCFDLIRKYETLLSRTIEGSDVWNINHSNGKPMKVSKETAALLRMALSYSELSGGAFDISIAPIVELWDFTGEEPHEVPDSDAIAEALTHVNYKNILIEGSTVTLTDPDAAIDLGGIAKGYIADRLREYLTGEGIVSGMIDLGGNILTIGTKPDGSCWKIGVRRPFGDASDAIAVVPVNGQTVVTSGIYERCFEIEDTIYHHLLDPATGYPADNELASVTILSDSSAEADALSTSCFVLGPDKGMELIESLDGADALFITTDLKLYRSSGFPE